MATTAKMYGVVKKDYDKEVIHDFIYKARFDSHTDNLYYKYAESALYLNKRLIAYKRDGQLVIFRESVYSNTLVAYNEMYEDDAYPFKKKKWGRKG